VVLCNAPLQSFVGPLWSFAVLCSPLRYLVIPTGRVGGRGTEYFDERVCLPVSVREHISGMY